MYGRVGGKMFKRIYFSPPRFLIIIFIIFFLFFSAFFLLAFFPALHITSPFLFYYFFFSFIFLPRPVEEADENVSPFPSFWQKNKEKDSLRAHSIIRPHSLTLFSVFFLFPLAGPSTQTRHRWRLYVYTHERCARSLICQPLPCCCCWWWCCSIGRICMLPRLPLLLNHPTSDKFIGL